MVDAVSDEQLKEMIDYAGRGYGIDGPEVYTALKELHAYRSKSSTVERRAVIHALASLAATISLLERGGKKAAPSDKMFEVMLDDYRSALRDARLQFVPSKALNT